MIVLGIFRKRGRAAQVCNSMIIRKRETAVITYIKQSRYRPGVAQRVPGS